MKKSKIAIFLSIIFRIILVIGTVCIIFLPNLYDLFKESSIQLFNEHSIFYRCAFYICYLICLGLIFIVNSIFKKVYLGSPFVKETEISLKRIAILFMLLSFVVFIKCLFIPTILSFATVFITFIASLSFYVLSQVFKIAIEFKHEIDLTV